MWPKKRVKTSKFDQIVWFSHRKRPKIKKYQGEKSVYFEIRKFEIIVKKNIPSEKGAS